MAGLGANATSEKRAKPDANCSPDRKRGPSPKPEKGSRGSWQLSGRGGVSVAVSGNRKGGASRPGAGSECWITGLETTMADVDNPRDSTVLLS